MILILVLLDVFLNMIIFFFINFNLIKFDKFFLIVWFILLNLGDVSVIKLLIFVLIFNVYFFFLKLYFIFFCLIFLILILDLL